MGSGRQAAQDGHPEREQDEGASEYGEELSIGPFTFITILFRYRGTVRESCPRLLAAVSIFAQIIKIYWCGASIIHSECPLAFSETAHSVAGGIIGFMLVFRTSISYYRFYEVKYLGHLYDCIRNANIAFLPSSALVTTSRATMQRSTRTSRAA